MKIRTKLAAVALSVGTVLGGGAAVITMAGAAEAGPAVNLPPGVTLPPISIPNPTVTLPPGQTIPPPTVTITLPPKTTPSTQPPATTPSTQPPAYDPHATDDCTGGPHGCYADPPVKARPAFTG